MSEALAELLLSGWEVRASIHAGDVPLYSYDLQRREFVYAPPQKVMAYLRVVVLHPLANHNSAACHVTWGIPELVPMHPVKGAAPPTLLDYFDLACQEVLTRIRGEAHDLLVSKEAV